MSHEKVYVRTSGVEVRTARSRTEDVQPADVKPPANLGDVSPAGFDQGQHGPIQSVTTHTLPHPPQRCSFRQLRLLKGPAGQNRPRRPIHSWYRKLAFEIIRKSPSGAPWVRIPPLCI